MVDQPETCDRAVAVDAVVGGHRERLGVSQLPLPAPAPADGPTTVVLASLPSSDLSGCGAW